MSCYGFDYKSKKQDLFRQAAAAATSAVGKLNPVCAKQVSELWAQIAADQKIIEGKDAKISSLEAQLASCESSCGGSALTASTDICSFDFSGWTVGQMFIIQAGSALEVFPGRTITNAGTQSLVCFVLSDVAGCKHALQVTFTGFTKDEVTPEYGQSYEIDLDVNTVAKLDECAFTLPSDYGICYASTFNSSFSSGMQVTQLVWYPCGIRIEIVAPPSPSSRKPLLSKK